MGLERRPLPGDVLVTSASRDPGRYAGECVSVTPVFTARVLSILFPPLLSTGLPVTWVAATCGRSEGDAQAYQGTLRSNGSTTRRRLA